MYRQKHRHLQRYATNIISTSHRSSSSHKMTGVINKCRRHRAMLPPTTTTLLRSLSTTTTTTITMSDPSHSLYPHTFTPLDLGPDIPPLPNRVIMGSMHCGLEGHSIPSPLSHALRLFSPTNDDNKNNSRTLPPEQRHSHSEELAAYFAERAQNGVSLMVTGGVSPNRTGTLTAFGSKLDSPSELPDHRIVTAAVHDANPKSKILLQILHAGRYAAHPFGVSASAIKSPISLFKPREMTGGEVRSTILDYGNCAKLAHEAGYDGVEIMGSEGYLIHQFLTPKTNRRGDEYGGDYSNRIKFPLEIVREIRRVVPPSFVIMFRLSMLDLVENTSTWEEIVHLAKELEAAGVSIINTGIGWHESRIPTIATLVPRRSFSWVTKRMTSHVSIPLCTSNRINAPETIEGVLRRGEADLVSMARPFLADSEFMRKAWESKAMEINTCIACNQACLDHVFVGKRASCLVNPRACHELELPPIANKEENEDGTTESLSNQKKTLSVKVIGAGPAGLAAALTFAQFGHSVTIYDRSSELGGQFNMAKRIPGKNEFYETLRYFDVMLEKHGVERRLGTTVESLVDLMSDEDDGVPDVVVMATGVLPRTPPIPNIYSHPKILSYVDVLKGRKEVGEKVAIIGAGGIGVDVAEYLLHGGDDGGGGGGGDGIERNEDIIEKNIDDFFNEWNVDRGWSSKDPNARTGGLAAIVDDDSSTATTNKKSLMKRKITLMQRKKGKIGASLGKTTGWIHRAQLKNGGVELLSGCQYDHFDDDGNLQISINGQTRQLNVDNVVICAGQEKNDSLAETLNKELTKFDNGGKTYVIGGAQEASELDAKRAIRMGTRLAYAVEKYGVNDETKIRDAYLGEGVVEDEELLVRLLAKMSGKKL